MNLVVKKVALVLVLLAAVAVLAWKWSDRPTSTAVMPPPVQAGRVDSGARPPLPVPSAEAVPANAPGETAHETPAAPATEQPNVTGIVQSALGQPLAAAVIRSGEGAAAKTVARSDRDGRFRIAGLSPGEILLTAEHPDYTPSAVRVAVLAHKVAEVTIVLAGGGSIEGTVFKGAQPLPGASVMVYGTGTFPKTARSDDAGRYRINGLLPGEVEVECQVRVEGLQVPLSRQRLAYVEEDRVTTVDIDFPDKAGSIAGLVTVNDRPAIGGIVQVYSAGKRGEAFATAPIGKDGQYLLENAPPGELAVEVIAETDTGVKLTRQLTMTMNSGTHIEQNIELAGTSVIEGAIENAAPGMTYQVLLFSGEKDAATLQSSGEPTVASLKANAAGRFRIDGIEGGVYTVLVMAVTSDAEESPEAYAQANTGSRVLTVTDGETATVSVPGT